MQISQRKSWREKILSADKIWSQVRGLLKSQSLELPETARRPDIRLILDNRSGTDRLFRNPGDHSNSKAEHIPGSGDKTAAMIMLEGDTLEAQYENARKLLNDFQLDQNGLSEAFITAMNSDRAGGLVKEAYGPAPFADQSGKLAEIDWGTADGGTINITPVFTSAASLGARPPAKEKVFAIDVELSLRGTGTTAEAFEDTLMFIAVSEDWQTGAQSTRPIVPSVAKEFYGNHFDEIPTVTINPNGEIRKIDLKNGTAIDLYPAANNASPGLKQA